MTKYSKLYSSRHASMSVTQWCAAAVCTTWPQNTGTPHRGVAQGGVQHIYRIVNIYFKLDCYIRGLLTYFTCYLLKLKE